MMRQASLVDPELGLGLLMDVNLIQIVFNVSEDIQVIAFKWGLETEPEIKAIKGGICL